MNKKKKIVYIVFGLLAVFLIVGLLLNHFRSDVILQGQLEAEEMDVAPKVSGRVANVLVEEGEQVTAGTPLIEMDSPEIAAKLKQAQAAQEAAQAMADKAEQGARPQEIEMAKKDWQRSKAQLDLAQKTYNRIGSLAKEGLLSKQKRDEAYAQYIAARDLSTAAYAKYEMAIEGSRLEDKQAAIAQAKQVDGLLDEVKVAQEESQLHSPVSGEVAKVMAKKGEITPQGAPVVTIVDLQDQWVLLNVREDMIRHFALKSSFKGEVPALSDKKNKKIVEFTVFRSAVLPDFATWRSTRNNDGFDLKTFEIKARPSKPIENMRPGMSVLVKIPH